MIDEEQALKRAFNLIKQGNYQEASLILSRLDSSTAEEWLQRLSTKMSDARQGLVTDSDKSPIGRIPGDNQLVISRVQPRRWGIWAAISGVIGIVVTFIIATLSAVVMLVLFNEGEYMLLLVPLLAAAFSGIFLRVYMAIFQVKTVFWVAFLALFLGMMTYGMYWQLHYINYPINSAQQMTAEEFDKILIAETGQTGALGFIEYATDLGQPVIRGQVIDFFDEFYPAMSPEESQLYWLVELAILLMIPVLLTRSQAVRRSNNRKESAFRNALSEGEIDAFELVKSPVFDQIHESRS